MKKLLFLLLTASLLCSCTWAQTENPDPGFNDMYGWDKDSAEAQESKKEITPEKTMEEKKPEAVADPVKVDQSSAPQAWDMIAIMETTEWTMKFKMFPEATPKTYENFKWLSEKWFYDGIIFHRVIANFMIQWWDPTGSWMWWESLFWAEFEDEPSPYLKNIRWALSMANRWPNTNTSQFFVVQAEATPHLDGYQWWQKTCWKPWKSCHTVFWQIFEWIEVVDTIANAKTDPRSKPVKEVKIVSLKIEEFK